MFKQLKFHLTNNNKKFLKKVKNMGMENLKDRLKNNKLILTLILKKIKKIKRIRKLKKLKIEIKKIKHSYVVYRNKFFVTIILAIQV